MPVSENFDPTLLEIGELKAALDAHAIVAITDPQGKITFVNDRFCAISGYSREELVGQDHRLVNAGHHPKDFVRELWAAIGRGVVWKGEFKNRAKDGSLYWVDSTIVPVLAAGSKPRQYVAISDDITSRKQSEAQFRLLETCVGRLNDIVLITEAEPQDEPGPRIVFVNDAFIRRTGYSREETIGRSPRFLQGPKTSRAELDRIRAALRQWQPVRAELINYTKSGHELWLEIEIVPVADATGWFTHWVAVERDVTERKRAQAALQASEGRYRTLFAYAPDGILIADPQSRYLDGNASICRMLGYTREELIGLNAADIVVASETAQIEPALRAIKATSDYRREWQFRRKDGSHFVAEVFATTMPDGNLLGMVRDVTQRRAAEESLRASETRFATIFRSSPVALGISRRRDLVALDVNEAFVQILECTREEIVGKTILQTGFLDPETLRSLNVELDATGIVQNREITIHTRSGRPVHAILSVKTIELGGEVCSLSILVDITARKLAEEKLRLHEAVLRETGQIAKVGGWSFEVATGEGTWTDEVARIHDLDPAAPISKEIGLTFYTADSRRLLEPALQEAVERGTPYDLELEIQTAAGVYKWIRTIGHPVWENGQVVRLRGSFQDITERKQAELRLKLQHAVTTVLAEASSLSETNRRILEALGRCLGFDLGELWTVDRSSEVLRCAEVWHPPSTEFSEFAEASRQLKFAPGEGLPGRVWQAGHADWSLDITRDPNCERRALAERIGLHGWIGFPIKLRSEILGVVGFFSARMRRPEAEILPTLANVGTQFGQFLERQRLAEQFRQAQKMEAIGTLAGGVAHDFNNILSAIMGYAGLIKMSVGDDAQLLEFTNEVEKAGLRATKLVRQILTFSRREESKRKIQKLEPIVEEAARFLRATLPSAIELEVLVSGETPPVLADSTQVHQAVMNLGTNAWHAMKERSGRLELKLEQVEVDADLAEAQLQVRPGQFVRLSVSDTGLGMDRATLNRIFEPFFTTKGPDQGTGLGLSVVHGIMKGHDGAVTVYSVPNEGTTFHLYFPAVAGETLELAPPPAPTPRGNGERILYVDDEEPLALLAQRMLLRLGYLVETKTRVLDALELLRAEPGRFDLVITDMTMPVMSGVDFAQRLVQMRPGLPVILTTGYPGSLKLEQIRAFGVREILLKPPSIQTLGAAVHRALTERRAP